MKNKKSLKILAIVLLVLIPFVYSIPTPHGISGSVYELDGITKITHDVEFSVTDLRTEEYLQGWTGRGITGDYSVSLNGDDGNVILIKAWNPAHSTNITVPLNGVMSNVNLYLNMTLPPYYPNITTKTLTNGKQDSLYIFKIETKDWNYDEILNYELIKSPELMIINNETGIIQWLPTNDDVGEHIVSILVTDSTNLTANKSFILTIDNVNDAPIITSNPVLEITAEQEYSYNVEAYDIDNDELTYSLIESPLEMSIENKNGMIKWKPNKQNVKKHKIIIQVSDGNLTSNQLFELTVNKAIEEPTQGGSGGGGGGSPNIIPINEETKLNITDKILENLPSLKVKSKSNGKEDLFIEVKELKGRPKDLTKKISKKVYQYVSINKIDEINYSDAYIIQFKVKKKWIEENGLNPDEIILSRFNNLTWHDLVTTKTNSDKEFIHYEAETPGFSYFAITIKDGTKSEYNIDYEISGINAPHRLMGIIYLRGNKIQVEGDTKVSIRNLMSNETIKTSTGVGENPGGYYIFVDGNENDKLEIIINDEIFYVILEKDMEIDFELNKRSSNNKITGFITFKTNNLDLEKELGGIILLLINGIMLIICIVIIGMVIRKKR